MSLEFLRQNAELVSALAAAGSFLIWSLYAVLFYSGFRRQRSSHVFIHAAGDGGPTTECVVINLSPEPVHILCSIATCRESAVQIQAPTDQDIPIQARAKQGPLESGSLLSLGRFVVIMKEIERAGDVQNDDDQQEQLLEVRVAAIHGLSDQPVGASRRFLFDSASTNVIPAMAHTEQKRSRWGSRQVRHWMEDCESYREADNSDLRQ